MTVEEIIKKYLLDNGCDGLCNEDCYCMINDLMPCDFYDKNCECAKLIPCPGLNKCDLSEGECSGHMVKK